MPRYWTSEATTEVDFLPQNTKTRRQDPEHPHIPCRLDRAIAGHGRATAIDIRIESLTVSELNV